MKIILYRLYGLAAALCLSFSSSAQDTLFSSVPGTSFADIITAMKADTTIMNDTSEGGGRIKLLAYEQLWKDRVGKTDSSGTDMFTQYYQMLHDVLEERHGATKSTSGCSGSGFAGSWEPLGPHLQSVGPNDHFVGLACARSGITTWSEALQTTLTTPMLAGVTYRIGFWAKNAPSGLSLAIA